MNFSSGVLWFRYFSHKKIKIGKVFFTTTVDYKKYIYIRKCFLGYSSRVLILLRRNSAREHLAIKPLRLPPHFTGTPFFPFSPSPFSILRRKYTSECQLLRQPIIPTYQHSDISTFRHINIPTYQHSDISTFRNYSAVFILQCRTNKASEQ